MDTGAPDTTSGIGTRTATDAGGATEVEAIPSDLRMAGALWPLLVAVALGLVPFTVFSTFLVPIADETGRSVAIVGGLRGLGGLAAFAVGAALAPLIDRVPRAWAAAIGLLLLGASTALGSIGGFYPLAAFCLLIGASTAVLNPALVAAAADRFGHSAAAGRAATLVTATQSMTAMLVAPLVALPALLWGWQGDLIAVTVLALILVPIILRHGRHAGAAELSKSAQLGYLASVKALAAVPGAVSLLLIALLHTAAFMGYLAYLAAVYDHNFQIPPGPFALVWTLSGTSFFLGNLLTGRFSNAAVPRVRTEHLLPVALLVAVVCMVGFYLVPVLPLALALTALLGASHAAVAACIVSLLVRRCSDLRGSALSLTSAAMSLGTFAGASLGGIGLGLAGHAGIGLVLGSLTFSALVLTRLVRPSGATPVAAPSDHAGAIRFPA
jgi:predicted MFS family arabinose efflux permease